MEMHQIRYVLAAAEHLNFTRAAALCDVSQPALTKGIKALETDLGAPLFHREGRRIIVSEFGRSLLPHLRQIAAEAEAAQTLAHNFHLLNEVPVRLGVLSSVGHLCFSRFLRAFDDAYDKVELALTERSSAELRRGLLEDEIDLAVVSRLPELEADLSLTPLYAERYVVILTQGHPLGMHDAIPLSELNGQPYVDRLACEMRELVRSTCQADEVELYPRFRSERDDWVQAMVLAGIGFAFMPEYSVTLPGLVQRPLIRPTIRREICLASVPGRPFPPAVSALVRLAKTFSWPG